MGFREPHEPDWEEKTDKAATCIEGVAMAIIVLVLSLVMFP